MITIIYVLGIVLALHSIINGLLLRRPGNRDLIHEKVALLVPARNEERNIKECLDTLENQRHLDQFSIFVLDDSSTDNTNKIIRERVNANSKIVLLRGGELPEGWTGKNSACWQLAQAAENFEYLVFVDADVRLRIDAVAKSINALKKFRWQYVCPYPRQLAKSWSEWLIQPLLQWSWITTLPLRLAEKSVRPELTAANGQFFIVEKGAYFAAQGHKAIHEEVLDDIHLARQLKRNGFKGNVIDGSLIASCRMYTSWRELRDGYTKSLWSAFGSLPGAMLVLIFLISLYVFPAIIAFMGYGWGISLLLFAYITRLMAAMRSQSSLSSILFHPLAISILCYLIVRSWWLKKKNRLHWKARSL